LRARKYEEKIKSGNTDNLKGMLGKNKARLERYGMERKSYYNRNG